MSFRHFSADSVPNQGYITYNAYSWNSPVSITYPGGTKKEYTYDPLMRQKSINVKDPRQNQFMTYNYQYAPAGNITAKNTEHGNYSYQYDELYRLTDVVNPVMTDEVYTYDAVGNRLTSANVTGAWSYNQNNELLAYDGVSNEYDKNGNTIAKTENGAVLNYVYDTENRLIRVEDSNGSVIAEYYYDPVGRRLKKIVGSVTTYFLYSDEGLIGEYDTSGNEIKTYGYEPGSTWTTNPLFQKIGANYYWYQNDHLGTPQKITDTNGRVVWSATYDSFGNIQITVAEIENNLRFPGQYYDAETGLYYNYHRYYEPEIGRYPEADPIGLRGGINLYAYVGNNPINRKDPQGLFWDGPDIGDPGTISLPPGAFVLYGDFCGKGAKRDIYGDKSPDCIDRACQEHDICYDQAKIKIYPPFPPLSSKRKECDKTLCWAVYNCPTKKCETKEAIAKVVIMTVFYCLYIM